MGYRKRRPTVEEPSEREEDAQPRSHMELLAENLDDATVAERLALSPAEVVDDRRNLVANEEQRIARWRPEEVFADYVLRTTARGRRLMEISGQALQAGEYAAASAAVKGAQDLHDRILKQGREFGFVTGKRGAESLINLTTPQFRSLVANELTKLGEMAGRYGDTSFEALPLAEVQRKAMPSDEPEPVEEVEESVALPRRLIDEADDVIMVARRDRVVRRAAR